MIRSLANFYLGLGCLLIALLAVFVWIPLDTDTGLIEKVRRRVTIGDALAPTIAAFFVGLGGLLLVVFERKADQQPAIAAENLRFVVQLLALLAATFAIMRFAGPLAVAVLDGEQPYRVLRDTAPWKWIGFILGGVTLIVTLIGTVERRLTPRAILVAIGMVAFLIAVFDLPFDDLLLPPNGDV